MSPIGRTPVDVSVVVPTHDRSESLRRTLETLAQQRFDGTWELIVVNNCSTDDTDAVVCSVDFPVRVVLLHEARPGASAARNRGIRAARGRVTVFLDDDILAPADMLTRFVGDLQREPSLWVLGQTVPPVLNRKPTVFERYQRALASLLPADRGLAPVDSFASGISAVPTEDLLALGGYNEAFPGASLEDADLYVRARRMGRRVVVDPAVIAVHDDWAGVSLESFCLRQRLYSRSAPLLAAEFGRDNPRRECVERNSPILASDGRRTRANKRVRALLGTTAGQSGCFAIARIIERTGLGSRSVYPCVARAAVVGSMYRGLQEGISEHGLARSDLYDLEPVRSGFAGRSRAASRGRGARRW